MDRGRSIMNNNLQNILAQLNYFVDKKYIKLGEPTSYDIVTSAEARLECRFSNQMRLFFKVHNGAHLIDEYIPGIYLPDNFNFLTEQDVLSVNPDALDKAPDIVGSNLIKRTFNWWPSNWLEIGQDSFGCFYVADIDSLNAVGESQIFWVDHESMGVDNPERKLIAEDYFGFLDWTIKQLINRYDRNGNPKL